MTEPHNQIAPSRRWLSIRLKTLFIVTAIVAAVTAYLLNEKSKSDKDARNIRELYRGVEQTFDGESTPSDYLLSQYTTTYQWGPTALGRVTGISYLKRVETFSLMAHECSSSVWKSLTKFDGLKLLIIHGDIDAEQLETFRNDMPKVEIVTMPVEGYISNLPSTSD